MDSYSLEQLTVNWNYPTIIHAGAGKIKALPQLCQSLGMQAPLLITDPGLAKLSMVQEALQSCKKAHLHCDIFSAIKGNPTDENINHGVEHYQTGHHDGVIGFGGGSAMDASKAIALLSGQNRPLWDFEDEGDNFKRAKDESIAPIIAIPTTAGTGSEVGRVAIITDVTRQVKRFIFHPKLLPSMVILDPKLTCPLSPSMTAATGMDALSHNLEAYCAPSYHPMASGIAIEAIRLIKNNLHHAVTNGSNIEARMHMLTASLMGATAFQRGLGGMHALSHPLGAIYDAHHGLLNAILMPYVLIANRKAIEVPIERLSRYINIKKGFDGFLEWILILREQTGIPHSLAHIDIDTAQSKRIGQMATKDPSAQSNPILFSASQYSQIFCQAVNGEI